MIGRKKKVEGNPQNENKEQENGMAAGHVHLTVKSKPKNPAKKISP